MIAQEVQSLPDAGKHPQGQHIHLEDAQFLDVVLIPFNEAAIRHGPIADGHGLREQVAGEDEAADMLRKVARYADHLLGQRQHALQMRIGKVQPRFIIRIFF